MIWTIVVILVHSVGGFANQAWRGKMVRSRIVTGLFFILCVAALGGVEAGDRHHNQSVCDEADLIGAAYGACNAYCEALDCAGPGEDQHGRACNQALDRFFELTGEYPPCEPLCPCASGWLNPEFLLSEIVATSCYAEISDIGKFVDLRIEGAPDENGEGALSAAALYMFDDDIEGSHRYGCFSERFEDRNFVLSEDSGNFEAFSSFRNEGALFDSQQNDMFNSCKKVLNKIIRSSGAECVENDIRSK